MSRVRQVALSTLVELCRRGGWRRRGGLRWWERHPPAELRFGPGELGDELRAYLAGRADPSSALAWLGQLVVVDDGGDVPESAAFERWVTGTGGALLDALVDELRGRWRTAARGGDVVDAFLGAADRRGARELAIRVMGGAPLARGTLARWAEEARAVRFFDDGHAAAQGVLRALEEAR